MGMILRIASSRIVGQGDIVGRSGYFSLNLSANSVMRGRLDARRTLKSLVADLRHTTFIKRLPVIVRDAWKIVSGVLIYILIGIGIGAFMHGFVPEGFFEQYMSKDNWFAVPLSVILAVPMYANAAGIVPVIEVFVAKGIPMGTAIAFMMAVVGLSLPEATLLKKVMTWRLIAIFFGTVAFFIILSGYLFNFVL